MRLRRAVYFICMVGLGILFEFHVALGADKMSFWDVQRKGTNCFNQEPSEAWFDAAKSLGVQWVRLAFDKWDGKERDFLMGDADHYRGLVKEDLAKLKMVLGWAAARDIKVVITPLGLPGNRWVQLNGGKRDLRLWRDRAYWEQAAAFWRDLAFALRGHPAVIGYNILNEPTPEMGTGLSEYADADAYAEWYRKNRGTPRDIVAFYQTIIARIRSVDRETPIMLDSGWFAKPNAFTFWPRLKDDRILYSVHMYEPFAFTSHLNFSEHKGYAYPGRVPFNGRTEIWDRDRIRTFLTPFLRWAKDRGIPSNRLVVAEFGCYRRNKGAGAYLGDVIQALNENSLHWAFYSFREDGWDGMDYELGSGGLGEAYWKAKEAGLNPPLPRRNNPLFEVIRRQFQPNI